LDGVGHTYAAGTPWEHQALQDVDLSVNAGEGLLVVGDNGSGKSTLGWIMAGLVRPTRGSCLVDGRRTYRQAGVVGLAFQHSRLQLQRPTVGADIVEAAGWTTSRRRSPGAHPDRPHAVADALERVGLDPALASRSIDELSGGQMRRVAIAGLVARGPRVLVLDEPFAGLDPAGRADLTDLLRELREDLGFTLVIVSHDLKGVSAACTRMIRLDAGRLVEDLGRRPAERAA
jgi:energy-coupling factor transport system ATP-binding protein